jgi:hypothetical protein
MRRAGIQSFIGLASKMKIWWLIKVWDSKVEKDQKSLLSFFIKGNLEPELVRRPPKIIGKS